MPAGTQNRMMGMQNKFIWKPFASNAELAFRRRGLATQPFKTKPPIADATLWVAYDRDKPDHDLDISEIFF